MKKKKTGETSIWRRIVVAFAILMLIVGTACILYPYIHAARLNNAMAQTVAQVQSIRETPAPVSIPNPSDEPPEETPMPYADLYAAMQAYNEQIYQERQSGLCDAWAYTNPAFDLSEYGIDRESIGYVTIPSIDVEMPIYLGATYAHMDAGAAQLSQTSMPIGGVNTNCVIAGHNMWGGAYYFHFLYNLEVGDTFYITNLWETMEYRITEIKNIGPTSVDQILIQEGKDMVTLMTCWPTGSGGRYRLCVYGERVKDPTTTESAGL